MTLLATPPQLRLIRGRDAILQVQPMLAELAARCGQAGEMDSLYYFLSTPDARRKRPCLVLIGAAESPSGAVLLFEYVTPLGLGARVFGTTDGSGRRNVIAPRGDRSRIAALAAQELIDRGAHIVQIGLNEEHLDNAATPRGDDGLLVRQSIAAVLQQGRTGPVKAEWALREREVPMFLPLLDTFEETLARMGKKTRANLRYYRRRCEADLGSTFVPDVTIDRETFLAFSRVMFWPVTDKVAKGRFGVLSSTPTSFLCGIRDREGRWLSLVRGRRQAGMVEIDWLMNRADLPAYSLSTVVRSYLIEHEIGRGSKRLYIEGGTAMPMRNSFVTGRVAELTMKRRSAYVRLLERLAAGVNRYVATTLVSKELEWRPVRRP